MPQLTSALLEGSMQPSAAPPSSSSSSSLCSSPSSTRSFLLELLSGLLMLTGGLILAATPPRTASFTEQDAGLSFPQFGNTVSGLQLPLLTLLLPLCIMVPSLLLRARLLSRQRQLQLLGWLLLAFLQAIGSMLLLVDGLKAAVGRPRPYFLSACDYKGFRSNSSSYLALTRPGALGSLSSCLSQSPAQLQEAQRSFPSGHSSMSWAGLVFLTLFLQALVRARGLMSTRALACAAGPVLLACFISVSRLWDRAHNYDDVAVGGAIGALCAIGAWRHLAAHAAERDPAGILFPSKEVEGGSTEQKLPGEASAVHVVE